MARPEDRAITAEAHAAGRRSLTEGEAADRGAAVALDAGTGGQAELGRQAARTGWRFARAGSPAAGHRRGWLFGWEAVETARRDLGLLYVADGPQWQTDPWLTPDHAVILLQSRYRDRPGTIRYPVVKRSAV